jgi:ABC-type antimicrobial peptide transport system ATPase subunit
MVSPFATVPASSDQLDAGEHNSLIGTNSIFVNFQDHGQYCELVGESKSGQTYVADCICNGQGWI